MARAAAHVQGVLSVETNGNIGLCPPTDPTRRNPCRLDQIEGLAIAATRDREAAQIGNDIADTFRTVARPFYGLAQVPKLAVEFQLTPESDQFFPGRAALDAFEIGFRTG